MDLPFDRAQFLEVFARYHAAVGAAPLALNALALAALAALWQGRASCAVAGLLALLWTWMALAYHAAFFAVVNPAAWGFAAISLAGAAAFLAHAGRLRFGRPRGWRAAAAAAMIAYALIGYPLLGLALGHRWPAAPSFGLPCPTTIFTIGVLLCARPPVPRVVWAAPLLWSAVGTSAAFSLGMHEDLGLGLAGLAGLAAAWPGPAARGAVA